MTGSETLFQKAMDQGHSAAWDQNWDQAAGFYRQALEEVPNHPKALMNLALALFELQQYEDSLRYYLKAAKATPGDPIPYEKVAILCERLGDTSRAEKASLQAAEYYLKNRDVNKAIENWQRVIQLNPENIPARSRLSVVYERMGRTSDAVNEYLALASLYQHANEMENAVRVVNHALQLMPRNPAAHEALAYLRNYKPLPKPTAPKPESKPVSQADRLQLEAPESEQLLDEQQDPVAEALQSALTTLASMLFESPDEVQTEKTSSKRGIQAIIGGSTPFYASKVVDPNRIMLHLNQVVELQTLEDYPQAAEELERAMDAGLDHAAAYFDLGYLRVKTDRYESAVRNLQHSVHHPDYALGSRILLGKTLKTMGRVGEASVEYLQALAIADSNVVPDKQRDDLLQIYEPIIEGQRHEEDSQAQERICDNVNELLMRTGWRANLMRARQQLPDQVDGGPPLPLAEVLIQARSGQVVDLLTSIYQLANEGLLDSAMEEAYFALHYASTYLPLHAYMGELLIKKGDLQDAISKLIIVAQTYNSRGEPNRAIDLYRRVIELAPMDLNPRSRLINLLIGMDKIDEALEEYLDFAEVYYSLADLEMSRKTYTEALRLAEQSPVDRSWQVKILKRMADIDLQSLDWRQSLEVYERIRSFQPDDKDARFNLVELNFRLGQESQGLAELDQYIAYLTESGETDQAILFVENLLQDEQDRAQVHVRLAELYQRANRIDEAIQQLDAAGDSLLEAGDRKGAIQVLERILTLNPPNRNDYDQLLAQLRGQ